MVECEFCKKNFSTSSSLQNHKKTTKRCIDIQRQLSLKTVDETLAVKTSNALDTTILENNLRVYKGMNQDLNIRLYEMQQMHEQEIRTLNDKYIYENSVLQSKLEMITKQYEDLVYEFEWYKECERDYEATSVSVGENEYFQAMTEYSWRTNKKMYQNLKRIVEDRTNLLSLYTIL